MNRVVRFEEEAAAEYRAAGRWYEERRVGLGLEFLDAVDACLTYITRVAQAGVPVALVVDDLPVRRVPVKRFPYQVVYVEAQGVMRVLAIAHDRRKPLYWHERV